MSSKHGTPLREALEKYFQRRGIKRRVQQASVISAWAEIVGPKIAEVTTPQEIRQDGTLIVSVKSAAWMQELQLMEPAIRELLGKSGRKVRRIMWRAE